MEPKISPKTVERWTEYSACSGAWRAHWIPWFTSGHLCVEKVEPASSRRAPDGKILQIEGRDGSKCACRAHSIKGHRKPCRHQVLVIAVNLERRHLDHPATAQPVVQVTINLTFMHQQPVIFDRSACRTRAQENPIGKNFRSSNHQPTDEMRLTCTVEPVVRPCHGYSPFMVLLIPNGNANVKMGSSGRRNRTCLYALAPCLGGGQQGAV